MKRKMVNTNQFIRFFCDVIVALICYVPMSFGMGVVYSARILSCFILFLTILWICMRFLSGKKIGMVCIGILSLAAWNTLATVRNGGEPIAALVSSAEFITVPMYFIVFRSTERRAMSTLKIWSRFLFLYLCIDLMTMFVFPKGMYTSDLYDLNWFLGYKTERMNIVFSMLIMIFYRSIKMNNRLSFFAILATGLSIVDAFLCKGMTMVATYFVMLISYWILQFLAKRRTKIRLVSKVKVKNFYEFFDIKLILVIYAVIASIMLSMQVNPLFKMILGWFGKDTTLSGRDHIWMVCLLLIREAPIFGHGVVSSDVLKGLTGFRGGTNAHNSILTVLITGGIIGLILYVFVLYRALHIEEQVSPKMNAFLLSAELAILVTGLTSSIIVFQAVSLFPAMLAVCEESTYLHSYTLKE